MDPDKTPENESSEAPNTQGDAPPQEDKPQEDTSSEKNSNGDDQPNEQAVTETSEPPKADDEYQLGDRIYIKDGKLSGRRGQIYYRSANKILVLPDGGAGLFSVPMVRYKDATNTSPEKVRDGEDIDEDAIYGMDPEYVKDIDIEKHPRNRYVQIDGEYFLETVPFVALTDLKPDQVVSTFKSNDEPGPTFKVKSVNEEEDTATFLDEEGDDYTIEFGYIGIPTDQPFRFFTNRFPPEVMPTPSPATAESEEQETGEGEEEDVFEDVGEEITVQDAIKKIETQKAKDILYDDREQRAEMFNDLMKKKGYTDADLRNPRLIKKNFVLTEQLFALRNDLVNYLPNGKGIEGKKPTSFATLSDILEETRIPLAKPVVDAKRAIYFDHSEAYYNEKETGGLGSVDPTDSKNPDIDVHFLADSVEGSIKYLVDNMQTTLPEGDGGDSGVLPKFYTELENYFGFFQPHLPLNGTANYPPRDKGKPIVYADTDVFRGDFPKAPSEKPTVGGLPPTKFNKNSILLNDQSNKKVYISRLRAISDRLIRLKANSDLMVAENGDALNIVSYLFFPFLYLREFGTTRSGDLALDIAQSMLTSRSMKTILSDPNLNGPIREREETKEGEQEEFFLNPDKILPIKREGSLLSNFPVAQWLAGQPIFGRGIGDLLPFLSSLGIREKELNVEQMKVLQQKVTQYIIAIKKFLQEEREKAKDLSEKQSVQVDLLLPPESVESLFKIIWTQKREAILPTALLDFNTMLPVYKESDIARIAYLYKLYPDLLMDTLAGKPMKENIRALRQIILTRRKDQLLSDYYRTHGGKPPKPNTCEHVEQYEAMKKVKNVKQQMDLLNELIKKYRKEKRDHWIWCKVCNNHLMCEHELLQVKEFLEPLKSKQYHKEILLNFNDGIFMGQYACKNCGQGIQEIEYDTHLEYNDEGKPMIGRETLEDKDQMIKDDLERALDQKPAYAPTEIRFDALDQQLVYSCMKRLTGILGIEFNEETYRSIVPATIATFRSYRKNRKEYTDALAKRIAEAKAQQRKPPKELTHDQYKNRLLVSCLASVILIEVQTHDPEYKLEYTLEGCTPSFDGFPLDPNKTNTLGISYLACGISSIMEDEDPWKETGYQSIREDKERRREIGQDIVSFLLQYVTSSDVTSKIEKKRKILTEKYGRAPGEGFQEESIPDGFVPSLISVPKDENAKKPFIEAAAKGANRSYSWLVGAHDFARSGAKLSKTSKQPLVTCCYDNIANPMKYWSSASLPSLGSKEAPIGSRGSFLRVPMTLRPSTSVLSKVNEANMRKLFIKVCYKGPRVGYPHEPGYDLKCPYCQYQFAYDPRDPILPILSKELVDQYIGNKMSYSKMIEKGMEAAEEQRNNDEIASLKLARVEVKQDIFDRVLDTMHEHYLVSPHVIPRPTTIDLELLRTLRDIPVVPFREQTVDGNNVYSENINIVMTNLTELLKKQSVTPTEIALAYDPITVKATEMRNKVLTFLRELPKKEADERNLDFAAIFVQMFKGIDVGESCTKLAQILHSVYLLPFQRKLTNLSTSTLSYVPKSLKLGGLIEEDIEELLTKHNNFDSFDTSPEFISYQKIKDAVAALVHIIPKLQNKIRVNTVPGRLSGYASIVSYLVYGVFSDLFDFDVLPRDYAKMKPKSGDKDKDRFKDFIRKILKKMRNEAIDFTDQQIRDIIEQRNEQDRRTILGRIKDLKEAYKPLEMQKKKLGIGEWAVGGTKAIYTYNEDQYARERIQREQANKKEDELNDEEANQDIDEQIQEDLEYEIDAGYDVADANDHEDGKDIDAGGVSC